MTNPMTNTVRLTNGTDVVTMTVEHGATVATLTNSAGAGESGTLGLAAARQRIANLVAAGWEVRTAG